MLNKLRKKKRLYLDLATGVSANPSSPHEEGRLMREELERARVAIARLVESKPDDVLFTSGATSANALAILGVTRAARAAGLARPHALYWSGSHASIVENMRLAETEGVVIEELPIKNCQVDCEALALQLRRETVLVALEAVDGETGVVWNTRAVARVLEKARRGIRFSGSLGHGPQSLRKPNAASGSMGPYLHIDASQAPWTQNCTRAHFGADLLTLDASKVSDARGIGCLIAPRTVPLIPLYGGGGQERGLVPGSEAGALARAFAEGLARAAAGRTAFHTRAPLMRTDLVEMIRASIPDALVNESSAEQDPHILNISLPGRDTDYLVALLDEAGFAVSTKSACESDSGEGSRAVFALWNDRERAASTLRISWGPGTRPHDLARFATALIREVAFIDSSKAP